MSGRSGRGPESPTVSHIRGSSEPSCLLLGAALFLGVLLVRVLFVQAVLEDHAVAANDGAPSHLAGFLTNDSPGYLRLAQDPFAGYLGAHVGEEALERPPGYPTFCAPFYRLGLAPGGVLVAQTSIAAGMPVMVMLLAGMLTGSLVLGGAAGALSAISPTGIGLSGFIMSDVLLAVLLLEGMLLLCRGATTSRSGRVRSHTAHDHGLERAVGPVRSGVVPASRAARPAPMRRPVGRRPVPCRQRPQGTGQPREGPRGRGRPEPRQWPERRHVFLDGRCAP